MVLESELVFVVGFDEWLRGGCGDERPLARARMVQMDLALPCEPLSFEKTERPGFGQELVRLLNLRRIFGAGERQDVFEPRLFTHAVVVNASGADGVEQRQRSFGVAASLPPRAIDRLLLHAWKHRAVTPRQRRAYRFDAEKHRIDPACVTAHVFVKFLVETV